MPRCCANRRVESRKNTPCTWPWTTTRRRITCRILAEMDLKEILKRRRMVRAYEPEPISRETIERIVGTVRRAPSAGFSQDSGSSLSPTPALGSGSPTPEGRRDVPLRRSSRGERAGPDRRGCSRGRLPRPLPQARQAHRRRGARMADPLLAFRRRRRRHADPARRNRRGICRRTLWSFCRCDQALQGVTAHPRRHRRSCCITIGRPADDSNWSAMSSRLTQNRKAWTTSCAGNTARASGSSRPAAAGGSRGSRPPR